MKRTMATALALCALGVALLSGCNRAKAEAPAPQPATSTATTTITTPAAKTTGAPNVDAQLKDVDGLLDQVDGQLKADSQNASDSD
jgi:hypothetical protein